MAKYIEEQEILWRMTNALDEQDTYLPIHFREIVIDECNASDVIERSKIDKAIEEMERYGDSFDNMGKHNLGSAVENCIEILKRNIGE